MTTSNTATYNENFTALATDALMLIGAVAQGESATTNDLAVCSNFCNKMLKAWMAQGIHLWTEEEGTLYFIQNQNKYSLSLGNSTKASDGTNTVETTTTATINSGSIIPVTSLGTYSQITVGDNIGVVLDSGNIYWSTVSSISNLNVTIAGTIPSQVTVGATVYDYTTQCDRPIEIENNGCRIRDSSGYERRIELKPRADFMSIPNKSFTAEYPTVCFYTPQMSQGFVYLWPTPSTSSSCLKFSYLRPIQDISTNTNTFDLPQEWLECITYNLAVRIAPSYEINLSSGGITGNPDILRQAAQYLQDLKACDSTNPYITVRMKPYLYR